MTRCNQAQFAFPASEISQYLENDIGLDLSSVDVENLVSQIGALEEEMEFREFAEVIASMIAVHETYFLRHTNQYNWIENAWLKMVLDNRPEGDIRILSAGCSTGEEPYSLYAHLHDKTERKIVIDAVDVNDKSLKKAKEGKYGLWSLRGVSVEKELSWLSVHARNVYVKEHIKSQINFNKHNLIQPLMKAEQYDLVLCRNVMIYMHSDAVEKIYKNIFDSLLPGGVLVPGPSDPNPPQSIGYRLEWNEGVRTYVKDPGGASAALKPSEVVANLSDYEKETERSQRPSGGSLLQNINERKDSADVQKNTNHNLIMKLIRAGNYDVAKSILESNFEKDQFDVRSYIIHAVLSLDLDDIENAVTSARKASFLEPDAPYTVYTMADVKKRLNDESGSTRDLQWVLACLKDADPDQQIKYCEDICVNQLRDVVIARLENANK